MNYPNKKKFIIFFFNCIQKYIIFMKIKVKFYFYNVKKK